MVTSTPPKFGPLGRPWHVIFRKGKTSRWWYSSIFSCSPLPLGFHDSQFDDHIFQMGWFNHQLEKHGWKLDATWFIIHPPVHHSFGRPAAQRPGSLPKGAAVITVSWGPAQGSNWLGMEENWGPNEYPDTQCMVAYFPTYYVHLP